MLRCPQHPRHELFCREVALGSVALFAAGHAVICRIADGWVKAVDTVVHVHAIKLTSTFIFLRRRLTAKSTIAARQVSELLLCEFKTVSTQFGISSITAKQARERRRAFRLGAEWLFTSQACRRHLPIQTAAALNKTAQHGIRSRHELRISTRATTDGCVTAVLAKFVAGHSKPAVYCSDWMPFLNARCRHDY